MTDETQAAQAAEESLLPFSEAAKREVDAYENASAGVTLIFAGLTIGVGLLSWFYRPALPFAGIPTAFAIFYFLRANLFGLLKHLQLHRAHSEGIQRLEWFNYQNRIADQMRAAQQAMAWIAQQQEMAAAKQAQREAQQHNDPTTAAPRSLRLSDIPSAG